MPSYSEKARKYLQILFEKHVCDFVLKKKLVTAENIKRILGQAHTGFSVYMNTRINCTKYHPNEQEKLSQVLRYISKTFYSQEKVVYTAGADKVLYRGAFNVSLHRNFEYFSPTDFIAAVTSHLPNRYQKYINYYGFYSSKKRGMRSRMKNKKKKKEHVPVTEEQRVFKKRWAQLIHQVYEVDPLICPVCKGKMRIISYIEEEDVIKRILKHLKLWEEASPVRPPPNKSNYSYEPINDASWCL